MVTIQKIQLFSNLLSSQILLKWTFPPFFWLYFLSPHSISTKLLCMYTSAKKLWMYVAVGLLCCMFTTPSKRQVFYHMRTSESNALTEANSKWYLPMQLCSYTLHTPTFVSSIVFSLQHRKKIFEGKPTAIWRKLLSFPYPLPFLSTSDGVPMPIKCLLFNAFKLQKWWKLLYSMQWVLKAWGIMSPVPAPSYLGTPEPNTDISN